MEILITLSLIIASIFTPKVLAQSATPSSDLISPTESVITEAPTAPAGCEKKLEGDANCDESIDLFDFLIIKFELLKHYVNTSADFDGNGVGISDVNVWKDGFVNNP